MLSDCTRLLSGAKGNSLAAFGEKCRSEPPTLVVWIRMSSGSRSKKSPRSHERAIWTPSRPFFLTPLTVRLVRPFLQAAWSASCSETSSLHDAITFPRSPRLTHFTSSDVSRASPCTRSVGSADTRLLAGAEELRDGGDRLIVRATHDRTREAGGRGATDEAADHLRPLLRRRRLAGHAVEAWGHRRDVGVDDLRVGRVRPARLLGRPELR